MLPFKWNVKDNTAPNNKCSKCGAVFTCKSLEVKCWCNNYQLTTEQIADLKKNYDNCLCEKCLSEIAKLSS